MKPKIINNNKVKKLPKEKATVKAALLRAMDDAQKDSWDKVFIIGASKNSKFTARHTATKDIELLGLVEIGKSIIYKDI